MYEAFHLVKVMGELRHLQIGDCRVCRVTECYSWVFIQFLLVAVLVGRWQIDFLYCTVFRVVKITTMTLGLSAIVERYRLESEILSQDMMYASKSVCCDPWMCVLSTFGSCAFSSLFVYSNILQNHKRLSEKFLLNIFG